MTVSAQGELVLPQSFETFTMSYNSADVDLKNHRLNAGDLAAAIKEMNDLLIKADKVLNGLSGKKRSFELFVEAPAKQGSLGIQFLVEMLNPDNALPVLAAVGVAGTLAKNIFDVAREMNGSTYVDIHTSDDSDDVHIELEGRTITSHADVAALISHPEVRETIKKIVTLPLKNHNQPEFKIIKPQVDAIEENIEQVAFNAADIHAIDQLNTENKDPKTVQMKAVVTFATVNFKGTKGWKVILDGKETPVEIKDQRFLIRIKKSNLSFKEGDEYTVILDRTSYFDSKSNREKFSYSLIQATKKRKSSKKG